MTYSIRYEDLKEWINTKANPGDLAYCFIKSIPDLFYTYYYKQHESYPKWTLWTDLDKLQKYLDSLEEQKMDKRCENCKHWNAGPQNLSFCAHADQVGVLVPRFTCCSKFENKEKFSTPFDKVKFFLKDTSTGELELKYVCEDCGKIMDEPFHWWKVETPRPTKAFGTPGYHFRCEECDKKKEGKIP